jgi:hypothetical protein
MTEAKLQSRPTVARLKSAVACGAFPFAITDMYLLILIAEDLQHSRATWQILIESEQPWQGPNMPVSVLLIDDVALADIEQRQREIQNLRGSTQPQDGACKVLASIFLLRKRK